MQKILIVLFSLFALSVHGQSRQAVFRPESFMGNFYRSNPVRLTLQYPAGTVYQVSADYFKGKGLPKVDQQPSVVDSSATGITFYWSSGKDLPETGFLEIRLNENVAAAGTLYIDYQATAKTGSTTLQFLSTSSAPILRFTEPNEPVSARYIWKRLMLLILK